jgi:hypothetical protein
MSEYNSNFDTGKLNTYNNTINYTSFQTRKSDYDASDSVLLINVTL